MNKKQDLLFDLLDQECQRQKCGINLIASENYASQDVLNMLGSCLTNKYVEGNVGARYYSGFEFIDPIEQVVVDRFKELFGAEHVNVQAHSGTQANQAVYFACLQPGDTVLSMNLVHGGHLSHGYSGSLSPVVPDKRSAIWDTDIKKNRSLDQVRGREVGGKSSITLVGSLYNIISYGVDKHTELIDYEMVEQLAMQHKPKLIIAGASAYSRIIDFERFANIAKKSGALLLADMAHIAGLVAAKLHPSPIPYAHFVTMTTQKTFRGPRGGVIFCTSEFAKKIDKAVMPGIQGGVCMNVIAAKGIACQEAMKSSYVDYQKQVIKNAQVMAQKFQELGYKVISGGTDNHMFLLDLNHLGLTGKQVEQILESVHIFVNRNLIPFDEKPALQCSGIRIGTAAITTRGAKEKEVQEIVQLIDETLKLYIAKKDYSKIALQVQKITDIF